MTRIKRRIIEIVMYDKMTMRKKLTYIARDMVGIINNLSIRISGGSYEQLRGWRVDIICIIQGIFNHEVYYQAIDGGEKKIPKGERSLRHDPSNPPVMFIYIYIIVEIRMYKN